MVGKADVSAKRLYQSLLRRRLRESFAEEEFWFGGEEVESLGGGGAVGGFATQVVVGSEDEFGPGVRFLSEWLEDLIFAEGREK